MEQPVFRIGPLAKAVGISPDSIRHYERLGLLGPATRTSAGYRLFSSAAVERLKLIRSAVQAGFGLRQLAAFLHEREAGGVPCQKVRDTAAEILARMDAQLAELRTSRNSLRVMLRDWDERLARTPANQPAHLLKSLPGRWSTGFVHRPSIRRTR
jgi:DNA-binding transcriptional MerR regulator